MTVKAPPNVKRPAFSPSRKISAVSENVTAPTRTTSTAGTGEIEHSRRE